MPSGNKVIGHMRLSPRRDPFWFINLHIYISSKTLTRGLCGSFDGDKTNDLFHRITGEISNVGYPRTTVIEAEIAASWRYTTVHNATFVYSLVLTAVLACYLPGGPKSDTPVLILR